MVYTLTLNPALDYIVNVPDFKEGTLNRTSGEKIMAGGKGINVSEVLGNLGIGNIALGFVAGFTGDIILKLLYEKEIEFDFINLSNGSSRINLKIKADNETEINAWGPEILRDELDMLFKKLNCLCDNDILVLSGSVPKNLSKDIYSDIMEYLKDKDVKVIVDAEGELLLKTLPKKPFLIKPNIFELSAVFNRSLETNEEIEESAKELINLGARNVLVSMGADGAIFVSEDYGIIRCKAPGGRVINTTGAGDSMVAGFIAGYAETGDFYNAVKLSVSAGSASAFSQNLATKEEIHKLYNSF